MSRIDYETGFLDNGLKVIVHEDRSVPKAVLNVVYKVGAKDENPDRTGFAHLFEHLMFGGSKNVPDFDGPLQRVGGDSNAFTNNDFTCYYINVPSNQIETAFWLESDRMLELDFSPKNLDVQRSVVIEEFKQRYLNKPYGDAHNILRSLHYTTHPYRWPTIGMEMSHIEGASLQDVQDFFYGFYAPNNATMVVAGDVSFSQVMDLANKWFGDIPKRDLRKHVLPQEPKQSEARQMTVERDVPHKAVYKMFHIPPKVSNDYYAADMLTDILSVGRASKLYQKLVKETQVATQVKAFSWGAHDPGSISIDCTISEDGDVDQYEEHLSEIIESLKSIENSELERVKNTLETHFVLDRTSILNKALSLSTSDVLDDVSIVNETLQKYLAITVDDVREAATEFLRPDNCSTLYYMPKNAS